jgi:hypothetical protein
MSLVSLILEQPGDGWISLGSGDVGKKKAARITDPNIEKKEKDGVWYYKEKKVVTPQPVQACPVGNTDEVKKFQNWLDINAAGWATGYPNGKLNKGQGYGVCGNLTKNAWTTYGNTYKSGGAVNQDGVSQSQKETLESLSSDPQLKGIIDVAKKVTFLDNNRAVIYTFNARKNPQFNEDPQVISTVKRAKNLLSYNNNSPLFSYIEAVIEYYQGAITGIVTSDKDIETELAKAKDKKIFENFFIKKSEGLINLLFEQTVFNVIDGPGGQKLLGGVKQYEDLGNVNADTYINYRVYNYSFGEIRPDGPNKRFPDKGPIIADIRTEIKAPIPQNVDPQVFDKTLYDAIKKYRMDNKIKYPNDSGYIDVDLIDYIYRDKIKQGKEKLPKSQQLQSPAAKQSTNEKKLPQSFGRVKEYARVIVASGDKGEKPNFDYCKFLLSEYPKLVKQTLTLYKANPELEIKTETDEIKNIKKGIKYCGTLRSGRTKISGLSNLFTSGVKDIENLTEPFGMKETEIYSLENKQKSDINSVEATPNNTIPKPGEVKTGIA